MLADDAADAPPSAVEGSGRLRRDAFCQRRVGSAAQNELRRWKFRRARAPLARHIVIGRIAPQKQERLFVYRSCSPVRSPHCTRWLRMRRRRRHRQMNAIVDRAVCVTHCRSDLPLSASQTIAPSMPHRSAGCLFTQADDHRFAGFLQPIPIHAPFSSSIRFFATPIDAPVRARNRRGNKLPVAN